MKNERGQTIVEYATLLALVLLASLVALTGLGHKVAAVFQTVVNSLSQYV